MMRHLLIGLSLLSVFHSISQEFPSVQEDRIPTSHTSVNNGKKIFEKHCTQCHTIFEKQIGPPLAYIYRFYDYPWLYSFITNSQKMVAEGDEYAVAIFNAYDKVIMPAHELTKDEVWDIIAYIKQVSETQDYNEYFNIDSSVDESSQEKEIIPKRIWWLLVLLGILSFLILFVIRLKRK